MNRQGYLNQYARHTPRLLRRQLILQLTEVYLGKAKLGENNVSSCCQPSIQRFQGALLFVDISGFTVLSQRISVEELKNHINEYFTIMLDIVDKHEGDVVKFAGDALFIVWTNDPVSSVEKQSIHSLSRISVQRAVDCGKEINEKCCNHKISFSVNKIGRRTNGFNSLSTALPPLSPSLVPESLGSTPRSCFLEELSDNPKSLDSEENIYLNVHTGVSVGLMAGVDIGADNRWEYFLIGEPLRKVAEAESQARAGNLIICPESHAMLHPSKIATTWTSIVSHIRKGFADHHSSAILPCGCTLLKSGYYSVAMGVPCVQRPSRPSRISRKNLQDDSNPLLTGIEQDIRDAVIAMEGEFKHKINAINSNYPCSSELYQQAAPRAFFEWINACLTDDIARHVHHALRSDNTFGNHRQGVIERSCESALALRDIPRLTATHALSNSFGLSPIEVPGRSCDLESTVGTPGFQGCIVESPSFDLLDSESHSVPSTPAKTSRASTPVSRSDSRSSSPRLSPVRLHPKKDLLRTILSPSSSNLGSSLSTELRNVTVMFVKIIMPDNELFVDDSKRSLGFYHFLDRSSEESLADQRLLRLYQKSIEVLSSALTTHGGQLRQYIVDDKGTVCIGTFGLRGSVSDDNVAAALDAAHSIIVQLQKFGLQCSIGVTVGRAYCGLVGSTHRHEYAVMGPSTNLSARLMGKAPAYGVICDLETKQRDRTHEFVMLDEVVAKGYSSPVSTFKPVFSDVEAFLLAQDDLSTSLTGRSPPNKRSSVVHKLTHANIKLSDYKGSEMLGRNHDVAKIIDFIFSGLDCKSDRSDRNGLLFDHRSKGRTVAILGAVGMGKSMLLTAVADRLVRASKFTRGYNVQLFKSRGNGHAICEQFGAWRSVILEIIARLYRIGNQKCAKSDVDREVLYVASLLPSELQRLYPLLGYLSIGCLNHSTVHIRIVSEKELIEHITRLLMGIIELYSVTCQRLMVIAMEDIHTFDATSLYLMQAVAASSKGVVLLFTGRATKRNDSLNEVLESGLTLVEFTSEFKNTKQYFELELSELNRASTIELAKKILQYANVHIKDGGFFDWLYEVSGGNPLYAFELAHSHVNAINGQTSPSTSSPRIEEVICFRFDQLHDSSQALLKMAAVICSNKSSFSLELLSLLEEWDLLKGRECFTYPELDYDDLPVNKPQSVLRLKYAKILLDVLLSEGFIRPCSNQGRLPHDICDIESLLSREYNFEFAIPLEQLTIYNLLLDDQKYALHEAVAMYFQRINVTKNSIDIVKEAFHWHKATVWSMSLQCFHSAFLLEVDSIKRSHYLEMSYQSLQSLYGEDCDTNKGISFNNLHALFDEALAEEKKGLDNGCAERPVLSLLRVYEMFHGDPSLLYAGVSTLLHVSNERINRFDNAVVLLMIEDALQMTLLTKNPFLMNSSYLKLLSNSSVERVDGARFQSVEMRFCLQPFWPLFFQIMSSYCINYMIVKLGIPEYSRKAKLVAQQFLVYARLEGTEIDLVQALCINALVQNKLSNPSLSLQHFEELKAMYVFEVHSSQLIRQFGADHVLEVLTRTIKHLALTDKVEKSFELLPTTIDWFNSLNHVPSMTLSVLTLVSIMAYFERFDDALNLIVTYEKRVVAFGLWRESIPFNLIHLYRFWLQLHISCSSELFVEDPQTDTLIKQLEGTLSSEDRVSDCNAILTYLKYDAWIILADIFAMKLRINLCSRKVKSASDGLLSCKYLQSLTALQIVDTQDIFCQARALGIAKMMLQSLSSCSCTREKEKLIDSLRYVYTAGIISRLRRESQVNQLAALNRDIVVVSLTLYSKE